MELEVSLLPLYMRICIFEGTLSRLFLRGPRVFAAQSVTTVAFSLAS